VIQPVLAGIIALTSRLWMIIAEVLLFVVIFTISKIKPISKPQAKPT